MIFSHFTLSIILLSLVICAQSVSLKLYDEAGYYQITPSDYDHKSSFIVSIWGGGSGSSTYKQNSQTYYCPGNSGSYIQMNVTSLNRTFTLALGSGGYSSLASDSSELPTEYNQLEGNYSELYSDGNFHIRIPGATPEGPNENWILNYTAIDTVITKSDGIVYDCYEWDRIPNGGYGAYSPYGHNGGNYDDNPKCDGYMGSGSGYNCAYCMVDEHYSCIRPYKGGDGAMILLY